MPLSYVEASVDDEEEEDSEQNNRNNENKKKKKKKKKKEAKENRLLIFSFSKAKKRIVSKIRRKPLSLNMSSSSLPSASASSGFWKYVCFCGIESPNTLEWSSASTSDPKDDNFTIDMLRALVQTNDFFSNDCNPHL